MTALYTLVCQIAAKLQQEGKTPSLALVRARAGKGVAAPELFSAYQQWRANPPGAPIEQTEQQHNLLQQDSAAAAENPDLAGLQQDIRRLEQKLDQALLLLQQLQQRDNS
ncbi:hypothetical protein [Rheinheimera sp. 4Y26]|uniref:hypothetical protein n=1 Tax=Rheinheimera sp. 4Y26 TaxID=2977811 RepID=UPI0021B11189|nr:hypothetical protein [Rheinheimera sp. 4Y26]MCT6700147.1 hypothetical protein [Rheinheimera sp. 4Y26]